MTGILATVLGAATDALSSALHALSPRGDARTSPTDPDATLDSRFAALLGHALAPVRPDVELPTPVDSTGAEADSGADPEAQTDDSARPGPSDAGGQRDARPATVDADAVRALASRARMEFSVASGPAGRGATSAAVTAPATPGGPRSAGERALAAVVAQLQPLAEPLPFEANWQAGVVQANPAAALPEGARIAAAQALGSAGASMARSTETPDDVLARAPEVAAPPARTAGSTATRRAAMVDVSRPYRGMESLNPEFRARFERVVERMESEFGHRITVVETHRHQARQDHLYEQGRSRPGPIVTWTRNSNHSQGRAADVMIDGTYDNPVGYRRLAQIAREEGLRTLGPRDPGHVELPRERGAPVTRHVAGGGESPAENAAPRVERAAPAIARGFAAVAAPAVASVARVATVAAASVGRVAQVATPGSPAPRRAATSTEPPVGRTLRAEATARTAPLASGTTALDAPAPAAGLADRAAAPLPKIVESADGLRPMPARGDTAEARAGSEGAVPTDREAAAEARLGGAAGPTGSSAAATAARGDAANGALGADVAGRVARVLELQQNQQPQPLRHVTMQVDGPDGAQQRIRLDLRGQALQTTIEVNGTAAADRLQSQIGQLQKALEQRGLEPESLRVRNVATLRTDLAADVPRLAVSGGETTASRSGADSHHPRERQGEQNPHRDPDGGSRNPSRRDNQGGKSRD
jgi:hypothetical protein